MGKIATVSKDDFDNNDFFWSSSGSSEDYAQDWGVYSDGRVLCNWYGKNKPEDAVRPVLAF